MADPAFHGLTTLASLKRLQSDGARGLASKRIAERRADAGPNRLDEPPPDPWWLKFARQFRDVLILILIAAALISGAVGEWVDACVILAIVLLNATLGFLQEAKAERALASLVAMTAPKSTVLRDGRMQQVASVELVPGDLVMLEAGDRVPADLRLIATTEFSALEAALTGESTPVRKRDSPELPARTPLAERRNMAYMGTAAASGKARGLVVATGMRTELGKIAELIRHTETEPTPLQRRLAELGRFLLAVCLVLIALIVALQIWQGRAPMEVFLVSVSLAVAAVPEGLPAIVTMALALGVQRMVRRNAIIRKLPSVETLGAVTTICSDKTGTLTRNEMSVRIVVTPDGVYHVSGEGYLPEGGFLAAPLPAATESAGAEAFAPPPEPPPSESRSSRESTQPSTPLPGDLARALEVGRYCNGAALRAPEGHGSWSIVGDPTEGALLVLARKLGLHAEEAKQLAERPFDSDRKLMSVIVERPEGPVQFTKGAAETLLPRCGRILRAGKESLLAETERRFFARIANELSSGALRTLALAFRSGETEIDEDDLVFAGMVGMLDPPRETARHAVATCRQAGIRTVMITGDHPATALAIGRELGIAGPEDRAISGPELDGWDDEELGRQVAQTPVYASRVLKNPDGSRDSDLRVLRRDARRKAMPMHRRRRVTRHEAATRCRPRGCDGAPRSASSPRLPYAEAYVFAAVPRRPQRGARNETHQGFSAPC